MSEHTVVSYDLSELERATECLVGRLGEGLESVLTYAHPFTRQGVLIVPAPGSLAWEDLLAVVHTTLPGATKIHCLRRRDLFRLALPGFACPPLGIDEQPQLAHCVKHRSVLLWGVDVRPEVPLPADPSLFLREHLRGCRKYFRTHGILGLLVLRQYRELLHLLASEGRVLLCLALLGRGDWAVEPAEAEGRYQALDGSVAALACYRVLADLERDAPGLPDDRLEAACIEGAWHFEGLMAALSREVS